MAENFYEYDEESDGFDEWEDIDLNRKEDEEFNFEINNSPLNTKKSKQVALSKLTKMFKQEYINQCIATHSIQAVFSVYNFKTVFFIKLQHRYKAEKYRTWNYKKKVQEA